MYNQDFLIKSVFWACSRNLGLLSPGSTCNHTCRRQCCKHDETYTTLLTNHFSSGEGHEHHGFYRHWKVTAVVVVWLQEEGLEMTRIASWLHVKVVTDEPCTLSTLQVHVATFTEATMMSAEEDSTSSPDDDTYDDSDILNSAGNDEVTAHLAAAGECFFICPANRAVVLSYVFMIFEWMMSQGSPFDET